MLLLRTFMTMNKIRINTLDDLRSAKARLYFRKEELEDEIKNEFATLKHSLTPSGIIENFRASNNSTEAGKNQPPGLMHNVAATAMDFLINDIFLRRKSYFKRIFFSYLIRVLGPEVMHSAGPIINKLIKKTGILNFFGSKPSSNGKPIYDEPVYTHGVG
jgi:predicted alternative tryptophan synthase beta-subunit